MRRNGLHAIRGWCLNQLQLCPGHTLNESSQDLEGNSWFAWTVHRYTLDNIVACAGDAPFVTLESIPLPLALQVKDALQAQLVLHVRSLENWLASSLTITRRRDGETNMPLHRECVGIWKTYAKHPAAFSYDAWVINAGYRRFIAENLGATGYDGAAYQRVHGIEYSSFDGNAYDGRANKMDLLHRSNSLHDDPEFRELLNLGATK